MSIEAQAFKDCTNLEEIVFQNDLETIGIGAFYGCTNLKNLDIPDSVLTIQEEAFYQCSSLENIKISNSITRLQSSVFGECSKLTSIVIPGKVKSIELSVFDGCTSLSTIDFSGSNITWIASHAFSGTKWIADRQKESPFVTVNGILVDASTCTGTAVIIPEGITSVAMDAFSGGNCKNITSITISKGLTKIENSAFNCPNLDNIEIPDSVAEIKDGAFLLSGNLKTIKGYTGSCAETFAREKGYEFVALDKGTETTPGEKPQTSQNPVVSKEPQTSQNPVVSKEPQASKEPVESEGFVIQNGILRCYEGNEEVVVIPDGVTEIDEYAFYKTTGMVKVVLPDGITKIGDRAFGECSALEEIIIPDEVTQIGEYAFRNCSSLEKIAIPDGVTQIEEGTFSLCSSLEEIAIPEGVTQIGKDAFCICSSLKEITIPEGVTQIEESAFQDCGNLAGISIPDSVTSIGMDAFANTKWLKQQKNNCTFVSANAVLIGFGDVAVDGVLVIPDGITSFGCELRDASWKSNVVSVKLPEGITDIGTFFERSSVKRVELPSTLQSIKMFAFSGCSELLDIEIPEGVTQIGEYAFEDCQMLTEINFSSGESVTEIGSHAFVDCQMLTEINFPSGLKTLGSDAFGGCTRLAKVELPEGCTSLGEYAFRNTGLKEIKLPDSLTTIMKGCFSGCSSLETITIPETVTSFAADAFANTKWLEIKRMENPLVTVNHIIIDGNTVSGDVVIPVGTGIAPGAFGGAGNLTGISLPEGLECIESGVFSKCNNLKRVDIPDSVREIKSKAFYGCSSLGNITIPDSVAELGEKVFYGCSSLTDITIPDNVECRELNIFTGTKWLENKQNENPVVVVNHVVVDGKTASGNVVIPEGVTEIAEAAFGINKNISSVRFPSSLIKVGAEAFESCGNLESVIFCDTLSTVTLEKDAFWGCQNLKKVEFPSSGMMLKQRVFYGSVCLESVYVPDNIELSFGSLAGLNENFTIQGSWGCNAQIYAKKNGIHFEQKKEESPSEEPTVSELPVQSDIPQPETSKAPVPTQETKTEIIENADGSITEKKTDIITNEDGSTSEKIKETTTRTDGSVTETNSENVLAPDGSHRLTLWERIWKYAESLYNRYLKKEEYGTDGSTFVKEVSECCVEVDGEICRQAVVKDEKKDEMGKCVEKFEYDRAALGEDVEWKTINKPVEGAYKDKVETGSSLNSTCYDITPTVDGQPVQVSDGSVRVTLFYGERKKEESRFKIYDCEKDIWLEGYFESGYVTFDVTHFSEYILTEMEGITRGDIDGNGSVALNDAQLALKAALKLSPLTGDKAEAADANGDGQITLQDAQIILKVALKLAKMEDYANH